MQANKFIDNIQDTKFNFVKNAVKFAIASVAFILVGILIWIFAGLNLGLDFTGGTILKIKFGTVIENSSTYDDYVNRIEAVFDDYGISLGRIQKEDSDENASITVRFQDLNDLTEAEMSSLVSNEITQALILEFNPLDTNSSFEVEESERIGATASAELFSKALIAIIIASALIMIYIAWRFEILNGLSTLICLIHDVMLIIAFVAIFRIQVNSEFIAAIITVIGYSINNTIIVFDRLRENQKHEQVTSLGREYLVNVSIKQTLVRSIYTSFSTLVAVLVLAIIGVDAIKEFLIPIVIGIIAGTYSSIFLAAPLWTWMSSRHELQKTAISNGVQLKSTKAKDEKNVETSVEVISEN